MDPAFSGAAQEGVRPSQEEEVADLSCTPCMGEVMGCSDCLPCMAAAWKEIEDGPVIAPNEEDDQLDDPTGAPDGADAEESQASKSLAGPHQPTQREIEEHEVSHLPFRSWCSACVRGRAKSQAHHLVDHKDDEAIPTISVDYGFMGKEGELGAKEVGSSLLPILIVKDRRSKAIWSVPVPAKGTTHPYPARALVNILDSMGYKRVILKSDQEASIKALCEVVKNGWRGEVVPENSPKYESPSNGEVERAVQEIQGIATTFKEAVEQRIGTSLAKELPILAWIILYAGVVYRLFHKGAPHDGKTPYQRLKGKQWKAPLPPFGEVIEYRRKTPKKYDAKWQKGLYIGLREQSGEKIVSSADGQKTFVVQSIRRKPPAERWDGDMLKAVVGVPWCPNPERGDRLDLPSPIVLPAKNPTVPHVPTTGRKVEDKPRAYYIKPADLEAYGFGTLRIW